MATGYTADVKDGTVTDFRTFALRCARAFGACILQRDDDMCDEPKHREPSDYYDRRLVESTARLKELLAMTPEQAAVLCEADRQSAEKSIAAHHAERAETRRRYEAMREHVRGWVPPTGGHGQLKQFMLEQLNTSIDFDCSDVTRYMPSPEPKDPAVWLQEQIASTREDIGRAREKIAEENARCKEANDWIDALYASLPGSQNQVQG